MSTAESNRAFVRELIARRGLTAEIEEWADSALTSRMEIDAMEYREPYPSAEYDDYVYALNHPEYSEPEDPDASTIALLDDYALGRCDDGGWYEPSDGEYDPDALYPEDWQDADANPEG